jgi:hypothetical protein
VRVGASCLVRRTDAKEAFVRRAHSAGSERRRTPHAHHASAGATAVWGKSNRSARSSMSPPLRSGGLAGVVLRRHLTCLRARQALGHGCPSRQRCARMRPCEGWVGASSPAFTRPHPVLLMYRTYEWRAVHGCTRAAPAAAGEGTHYLAVARKLSRARQRALPTRCGNSKQRRF